MIHPIVLGTAGHIDHGKTSLVRALTGIDTDRLPVEKARGITTELGFARLDLGAKETGASVGPAMLDLGAKETGASVGPAMLARGAKETGASVGPAMLARGERRIAVVDVPGHERFVKSMVAGATGLDLVCLVIAADEGVMPQTREHLEICDLLGVRRGLIVLTKRDLVDDDWIAMVSADIREAVAGTFLADAAIIPVSTKDLRGIDELRTALATMIDELPPRATTGVFRLPVDRVFTVKGFGTIVTGTILGGEVKVGDDLQVLPGRLAVRVRGIEVHGGAVDHAQAGMRAAINLGGVAVDDLARGDVLAHPDKLAPSHILDVELRYLKSAPGVLAARSKVLVHHATAQVLATLVLVGDRTELSPGESALAQLRLDATTPVAALPGDHFILRGFAKARAQGSTIAGGSIVRVLAPKARGHTRDAHAETVATLAKARLDQRISVEARSAAFAGLTTAQLVQRLGMPAPALAEPIAMLVSGGELLLTGDADHAHYLHATAVAELESKIAQKIAADPDGIARELLRTQLPAALPSRVYDAVLAGLESRGVLVASGDRVTKASASAKPALSAIENKLAEQLAGWKLEPPRPKDMTSELRLTEPQVMAALSKLVAAKVAVKIKPDYYVDAATLGALRDKLLAFLAAHGTVDAQQWKDLTGTSRKFSIPLAEHFDAEKVTLRIGDVRRKR